jgi:uncharacterized membrane protein SpoIIM required for sporulation
MNRRQFLQVRQAVWEKYDELLRKLESPLNRLTPQEAAKFSRLYREICADLAILRSKAWGRTLIAYLNHLAARGHNQLYRAPRTEWRQAIEFLAVGFPRTFRRNFGYFVAAALLFFGPLAASWAVVASDPVLAERVVEASELEAMGDMYSTEFREQLAEQGVREGDERAFMAGFYIHHNIGIAFVCFARGILLGVGSIYSLIYNGIAIGTIAGYVVSLSPDHRHNFLSFVASHGSFELTAIAVAGAGGLMMGHALVHPGRRTRVEALRVRGKDAVQMALGAGAMLFVAALIEAFWSPSGLPAEVKYIGAALMWLTVAAYLGLAGRR